MAYGHFVSDEGEEYGSFEVFYKNAQDCEIWTADWRAQCKPDPDEESPYTAGWYWWACFPGCIPDGDPMGPFKTEDEAFKNAREEE